MSNRLTRSPGENIDRISSQRRAIDLERDQLKAKMANIRDELGEMADNPKLTDGQEEHFQRLSKGFDKDVYAVYDALAARWKGNASWLANDLTWTLTRQFGADQAGHAFWVDLTPGTPERLIGRPVYSNSSMDGTVTAAADNHMIVFGNFNSYVVARRLGFTVELIPHMFATANNRPSGQRGLFGYARLGSDSVADGSFVLLNVT